MGVCAMVFCCTVMMVDSVFIKSTPLCLLNFKALGKMADTSTTVLVGLV